jgi:NTE family protein
MARRKPRVGLALGSGGARGWSHIGVIRALEKHGVKPEIVCGSSIGALVGAAYASGELDRLEEWVSGLDWKDVLKLVDVTRRGGLIRGQRLFDFIRSNFSDRDIESFDIAYAATELATGREIWLREGSVLEAVRASIAIPGPRTLGQWAEYLGAIGKPFGAEDEALIDRLVAPGHPSTPGYTDPRYPVAGRMRAEATG